LDATSTVSVKLPNGHCRLAAAPSLTELNHTGHCNHHSDPTILSQATGSKCLQYMFIGKFWQLPCLIECPPAAPTAAHVENRPPAASAFLGASANTGPTRYLSGRGCLIRVRWSTGKTTRRFDHRRRSWVWPTMAAAHWHDQTRPKVATSEVHRDPDGATPRRAARERFVPLETWRTDRVLPRAAVVRGRYRSPTGPPTCRCLVGARHACRCSLTRPGRGAGSGPVGRGGPPNGAARTRSATLPNRASEETAVRATAGLVRRRALLGAVGGWAP
jgi:hypothetical protein